MLHIVVVFSVVFHLTKGWSKALLGLIRTTSLYKEGNHIFLLFSFIANSSASVQRALTGAAAQLVWLFPSRLKNAVMSSLAAQAVIDRSVFLL